MEQKVEFGNSKGDKLVGILNETKSKDWIVVMVHGFNSSKNHKHFLPLVAMLEKENIATFRFDAYGQGESGGNLEDLTISEAVDDTMQAIKYVENLGYKNIGLLGTSLGGFVSTICAGKYTRLKFLALKSPVSDYLMQVKTIASPEDLASWESKGYVNYGDGDQFVKLNYAFFDDLKNYDAYEVAKNIKMPVLIVHGDADKTVSISQSQKLVKELPNARLVAIVSADHRYAQPEQSKQMVDEFYKFITRQTKPIV